MILTSFEGDIASEGMLDVYGIPLLTSDAKGALKSEYLYPKEL